MAPTAVKICPNSSCSSREMWRKVDSWVEINFWASSLRCSESAANRANNWRLERIRYMLVSRIAVQRRNEKQIDLTLDPAINLTDPQRGLLLAFVVLDDKPGDCCAQRLLPGLQ